MSSQQQRQQRSSAPGSFGSSEVSGQFLWLGPSILRSLGFRPSGYRASDTAKPSLAFCFRLAALDSTDYSGSLCRIPLSFFHAHLSLVCNLSCTALNWFLYCRAATPAFGRCHFKIALVDRSVFSVPQRSIFILHVAQIMQVRLNITSFNHMLG
jgi:hypothetical protein